MTDLRRRYPIVEPELFDLAEGSALVDGPAAVLKGTLESEIDCAGLLVDAVGPFRRLLDTAEDPDLATVLQRHRFLFGARTTPERRLVEAGRLASRGAAVAVVSAREVPRAAAAIALGGDAARQGLVVLVIDDPERQPAVASRRHFADLGMPVVEPGDLDQLRRSVEQAAALSDTSGTPAAIVVDESIIRSAATLEIRPNRVVATRDTAAALRRTRLPRAGRDESVARFARKLELDSILSMPSPGEKEELGIIATGLASTSIRHILEEFRLTGRVPAVLLRLVHPLDPAPIERLLVRCRNVIVVETRPGLLAPDVLEIAERLVADGQAVAKVGWRTVPGVEGDPIEVGEASRPSILVRRLVPGLRGLRAGLEVMDRLARPSSVDATLVPDRTSRAARRLLQLVRRSAVAADRALRREEGEDVEPMALAINGRAPAAFNGRVVNTEIVERFRLLAEAVPLVASRDPRAARVVLMPDEGAVDGLDAVRVLEAAVPVSGDRATRVRSVVASSDAVVRDAIVQAARSNDPEVLVIRRREAKETTAVDELDRLGYAPIIRVRSRLDDDCGVRARNEFEVDPTLPRPDELRVGYSLEQVRGRFRGRWIARVARLLEISEIVRQREPLPATKIMLESPPPPPVPHHRHQGRWRAHVAGVRGTTPGAAATLLARAGRRMGFDVRVLVRPEGLGEGLGTWAQVLFTRPARSGVTDTLVPGIPYGEADLILGVDPAETARSLGPDPQLRIASPGVTSIIADRLGIEESRDPAALALAERMPELATAACGTPEDRVEAFVERVRQQFGNPRLLDVVLLGIAFQRGLVPLGVESMQEAIVETERAGFGRTGEAFRFGRLLAVRSLIPREHDNGLAAIDRRRRELVLAGRIRRGRAWARSLDERIGRALEVLPGLAETAPGRASLDDLLVAIGRLQRRGGLPLVDRYIDRLARLHVADRGDTGRELTRRAVLVLGEAMLPRDVVGYAIAATSLDHRRRKHRRFGIRRARGDRVERAFEARIDLIGFERHLRLEVPVAASVLALIAKIGRLVPMLRKGDAGAMRRRAAIESAIDRAIEDIEDPERYREWARRLADWEEIALHGRLHEVSPATFE